MVESKTKKKKGINIFAIVVLAIIVGLLLYLNSGTKAEQPQQTTDTVLMVSPVAFDCIEQNGGGSAICMIAEIFKVTQP